jgi:transposase
MTYEHLVFEGRDTFEVTDVARQGPRVFVAVNSRSAHCKCPACGVVSHHIQSCYKRTLVDMPLMCNQTRIKLTARKFFCRNKVCERKVFTERFEEHFQSYKRVTERLANRLLEIAHECGGSGGERLCHQLGMPVSRYTLIRTIYRHPMDHVTTPKVLYE